MPTPSKAGPNRRLVAARGALLWLAAVRAVLGIVAIPLAPLLYRKHFLILVLLRPTKEVLLAGGFLVRQGDLNLVQLVAASLPLLLLGVWQFYALGLAYATEIQTGKGLPRLANRILPTDKINKLGGVLDDHGRHVVFFGRLASFPSSLLGAAAGATGMPPATFLPADGVGALASLVEVIGAGYLFGESFKAAGPWVTGVGVVVLFGLLIWVGRAIART